MGLCAEPRSVQSRVCRSRCFVHSLVACAAHPGLRSVALAACVCACNRLDSERAPQLELGAEQGREQPGEPSVVIERSLPRPLRLGHTALIERRVTARDEGEPRGPGSSCDGPLRLYSVARSSEESSIGEAAPALNDRGQLAFAASDPSGRAKLMIGKGRGSVAVDLAAHGLELPVRIALDDAGRAAFLAPTRASGGLYGAFALDERQRDLRVRYAAGRGGGIDDGGAITARGALALSLGGVLAFSSILEPSSGQSGGAVYRGAPGGEFDELVAGSDVERPDGAGFANVKALDINAGGTVAAVMLHASRCGVQQGVLVLERPEAEVARALHVLAGIGLTAPISVALNDDGLVAFALPGDEPKVPVLRCPPAGDFELSFSSTGVYTAFPVPFTEAPGLALVVDNSGPFASFGAVDVNAAGTVVFEAELDNGLRGIFKGPDPELDAILTVGDELDGELVSDVHLGQLNDACELSIATTGPSGRSIWRASGVTP